DDFYQRQIVWAKTLGTFLPSNKAHSDSLWKRYQNNVTGVKAMKIIPANIAFGNAFLDTSAIKGETYRYKVEFKDTALTIESEAKLYEEHHPELGKMTIHREYTGINNFKL